jgi:hypothetical protein
MMTGYYGVPGSNRGKFTVHLAHESRPVCGYRPPKAAEFQWCADGIRLGMIECSTCKRKAAELMKIERRSRDPKGFSLDRQTQLAMRPLEKMSLREAVDALGFLKAQMAPLEDRERALSDRVKSFGVAEAEGELFRATVSTFPRQTLSKDAVVEKLGQKWVDGHSKTTEVTQVRVHSRTGIKKAA